MNKLMVLALGLGIAFGSFAQDKMADEKTSTTTTKKAKKGKKAAKKMDDSKMSSDAKPKM